MSPSALYEHFRGVTNMTLLQFQKQLRFQEARRLMLSHGMDAASAGYDTGYLSSSQFNREYSRQFGLPPMRDVEQLRAVPGLMEP
jgi:AraC-like DNA-binding protein